MSRAYRGMSIWILLVAAVLLVIPSGAFAVPVTRVDFDASATVFDFSGSSLGDTVIVSPDLTVTGGRVNSWLGASDPNGSITFPSYTNEISPYSGFRIAFNNLVGAVGMDVHLNSTAVTLGLYDTAGNLLDFYRWEWPTVYPTPTFIGLDPGTSLVSYALVNTPDYAYHDMYIDNITYEKASVPEPSTLLLLASGVVGCGVLARRRRNG